MDIGYSDGDFADSVTGRLILPVDYSINGESVSIKWNSSNPAVIDGYGFVSRPSWGNETIKLTANMSAGNAEPLSKEFIVKVIKQSDFDYNNADNYGVLDINLMNENNPAEITYTTNHDYVKSITGKFSEVVVDSQESALQALYNVRSILGVRDPLASLKWQSTNFDDDDLFYTFEQYWNDYRVFGLSVTVGVDRTTGITNYLYSSLLQDEKLLVLSNSTYFPKSSVYTAYPNANIKDIETVVYASGSYEETPILAYLATSETEALIINANNGDLISRYSIVYDFGDYSTIGKGTDELGNYHEFPVQYHQLNSWFYYLEDLSRGIYVQYDEAGPLAHRYNTTWNNSTAVSAYVNTIAVYDWYKSHLNRDSIDGQGMDIYVRVHGDGADNAQWDPNNKYIVFFDNEEVNGGKIPTTAAALDIVAHEMTHGVFQYMIAGNGRFSIPYADITGAIMEGYSDVFGWFVDHDDYTLGEIWTEEFTRHVDDPSLNSTPGPKVLSDYKEFYDSDGLKDQDKMVHTNSSLVYHAAYLMEQNGLKGSDLEKVWYKSISYGYDVNSDYYTVRRNLINAGQRYSLSDSQMCAIRKAFDQEEIFAERGSLKVVFTDIFGNPVDITGLSGLNIITRGQNGAYPDNTYRDFERDYNTAEFSNIYKGTYDISVVAEGFISFNGEIEIIEDDVVTLQIVLVSNGEAGPINGYITSATTGYAVPYTSITVYEGWNVKTGNAITSAMTDDNGYYSIQLPTGYYTLVLEKEDYTTGYLNVVAAPEYNGILQNGSISPVISEFSNYRVVLTWGSEPSDLDAHLKINSYDGNYWDEVFYGNYYTYYNYERLADLDVDDRSAYGPETLTFEVNTELEYTYFIDWYEGSGTWSSCRAKVEIYNGDMLVYAFNAPPVNDQYGSWLIFTIKNGIFRANDSIVPDMYR